MSASEFVPKPTMPRIPDARDFEVAELFGNRLIVRRYPPEDTTKGGIILPDTAQQKQALAWIVKVGTGVKEGGFEVGRTVLFPLHALDTLPELGTEPGGEPPFGHIDAADILMLYPEVPEGATDGATKTDG